MKDDKKAGPQGSKALPAEQDKLKMTGPLSEKDEVKKAERRTQKSDGAVAAELKNRG